MRAWRPGLLLAAGLAACASLPEPPALDADAHARLTAAGFREASSFVAARLDAAAAWAVFPDVEDTREECAHDGRLFVSGEEPRPVLLRCARRPAAPAGVAYHVLVILEDPEDLARLGQGGLALDRTPHLTPHDDHGPPPAEASRWVVTSARGGLLFGTWSPRQMLELPGPEPRAGSGGE